MCKTTNIAVYSFISKFLQIVLVKSQYLNFRYEKKTWLSEYLDLTVIKY